MAHLFVSHAPEDLDVVLQAHEALRRDGVTTVQTRAELAADATRAEVNDRIAGAAGLVVLLSRDAMKSDDVRGDLAAAIESGIPLVPFRVDNSKLSGAFKGALGDRVIPARQSDDGWSRFMADAKARYRAKCPVVSVMNLKGGVGKTTVSAQLAGMLQVRCAPRILLVDLDPQYNLTQLFFSMREADARAEADCSVISLFERSRMSHAHATSPAENWAQVETSPFPPVALDKIAHDIFGLEGPDGQLHLISGQFEISKYAFAHDAVGLDAVMTNFLQVIDQYRGHYDLIVFDTNPNATFLTRCALAAADRVLAPMHADVYSLRGIRLLRRVIDDHVDEARRPALSVLFNAVSRNEQSDFEADAHNGVHDEAAGFPFSKALLSSALPRSAHLQVRTPDDEEPAWRRLLAHHGRGGGLKNIREALAAIADEFHAELQSIG